MRSRRSFLAMMSVGVAAFAAPARAFEFEPYDPAAVDKAIASGKPVVVHVAAWWCLQCHAQTSILDSLKSDPAYDGVSVFRVDYDKQKDIVAKLDCPRSTLIAFKGGKEVARMSWGTSREAVLNVLKAAM
jgi:thioredoxin 1